MSRPRVRALVASALAAMLATDLAACGHSSPTILHALTAAAPSTPYAAYGGPPVRVDAVRLPAAYDRVELLKQTGPGRFQVREFDRWAAPPARLARQALSEDLALRLPSGSMAAAGGEDRGPVATVSVEVLSFTPGPGGATLSAVWTRACRPSGAKRRADVRIASPPLADTPETLSAMIAQLADRIAADLVASGAACGSAAAG